MELGQKPLKGTLIEGADESKNYPRIYLMDGDTSVIGDHGVGDEVMGVIKVRISEVGSAADGSRTASLEVIEMQLKEKDQPTAADKMYPSVVGG